MVDRDTALFGLIFAFHNSDGAREPVHAAVAREVAPHEAEEERASAEEGNDGVVHVRCRRCRRCREEEDDAHEEHPEHRDERNGGLARTGLGGSCSCQGSALRWAC